MKNYNHPYHMVSNSPWPIILSFNLMNLFISSLIFFLNSNYIYLILMIILTSMTMMLWWRDVIRESTFQGMHTKKCKSSTKLSMMLFILSEIMFFVSLFWTHFHNILSPSIDLGGIWPPKSIKLFNPFELPLMNTIILISSGITLTYSHYLMMNNKMNESIDNLLMTITLGISFTICQISEYYESFFCMSDSICGSIFFMSTGFHGIHVLIGTIFLTYMYIRMKKNQFSKINHLGFELGSWYWHFVDVVWLILYIWVYWFPFFK